jgi:hypothetical protein
MIDRHLELLKKYSESNSIKEPEYKEERVEDVSSPTSVKELSVKPTERVQRDEYTLTYDELLDEYHFFKKSAVMKPSTFDRLWNS